MYVKKEYRNLINIIKYLNSKANNGVIENIRTIELMNDLNLKSSEVSCAIKTLVSTKYLTYEYKPSTRVSTYYIRDKL